MIRRTGVVALMALLLTTACASMRGVDVTSDPERTYRISVYNARGSLVLVEYSDGSVTRQLGQVSAGRTEPFVVVASPSNPRITVIARNTGGTTVHSQAVNLTTGQTTSVTIQ